MKQTFFLFRGLSAVLGIALLLTSALLLRTSLFGTAQFTLGLAMHLAGQACCITTVCLPAWWTAYQRRLRESSLSATVSALPPFKMSRAGMVRPAAFTLGVQGFRLLYGLTFTVALAVCLLAATLQMRSLLRLREHGVSGKATITGTTFREGGPLLTVTYAFSAPVSLPVTGTFRAPRRLLPQMQTGNTLTVTYLPSDPSVHTWQRVNNALLLQQSLAWAMLLVTLLAYLGWPLAIIERRLRRQLRLARIGVAVTGTIAACKPLGWRNRPRRYLLTYVFPRPAGGVTTGQALVSHVPGEPTLPGFPLTVLYDPLQPTRSLPLAAFHAVEIPHAHPSLLAV